MGDFAYGTLLCLPYNVAYVRYRTAVPSAAEHLPYATHASLDPEPSLHPAAQVLQGAVLSIRWPTTDDHGKAWSTLAPPHGARWGADISYTGGKCSQLPVAFTTVVRGGCWC
jgi:hypothetical protein